MKKPKELVQISTTRRVSSTIAVVAASAAWGIAAGISVAAALLAVFCMITEIAIISEH